MGGAYRRELAAATAAARRAGDVLLEAFQRPGGPLGPPGKCPTDVQAEELIHEHLGAAFPEYGFCGEEVPGLRRAARDRRRHTWIVDPNDGTNSFQRGLRGSAVSIALLRGTRPVLGVLYSYNTRAGRGDLLSWAEGETLLRNDRPPATRYREAPTGILLLSAGANRQGEHYLPLCAPARYRALPSIAYRLALAAIGAHSAALSTHPTTRELDVAGAAALLRGARRSLFHIAPRPRPLRFSGDGLRSVGNCVGGQTGFAHRLAGLTWGGAPPPPPRARPHDLLRTLPGRICTDPGLLERAQGCLLGQCLGDYLGSSTTAPRLLPGQPSAIGEAALMLARGLTDSEGYSPGDIAATHAWWQASQPPPTDHAHGIVLTRAAPLGIYGHSLATSAVAAMAHRDAALSHASPAAADACAVYCVALTLAVREAADGNTLYKKTLAWARSQALHPEVLGALESSAGGTTRSRRHPPTAGIQDPLSRHLAYAFRQLLHPEEPAPALLRAAARRGHSLRAALTGALLGAVHGAQVWPEVWLNCLLSCRPLAIAPGCHHPRPRACWPVDCPELAERLAWLGYRAAA